MTDESLPDDDQLIDREPCAKEVGVHPRTLDRWRKEKIHLPFYIIGRHAKYRRGDVRAFKRRARVEVHTA